MLGDLLEEHPQLPLAIIDAFALIAASDGEAHESERDRLEAWLQERSVADERRTEMLRLYSARCTALVAGDDEARAEALAHVRWAADVPAHRDVVIAAGHAAIVADRRIDGREEVTIRELAEILGVDPDDV